MPRKVLKAGERMNRACPIANEVDLDAVLRGLNTDLATVETTMATLLEDFDVAEASSTLSTAVTDLNTVEGTVETLRTNVLTLQGDQYKLGTGTLINTAGVVETVISDAQVALWDVVILSPRAEISAAPPPWIKTVAEGSFTVGHAENPGENANFDYVIFKMPAPEPDA